jgi:predicted esterase
MISEEIVHVNGIPKKLIVFLHGYQDCAEHIDRKTSYLQTLNDVAIHIPQAPFINEIDNEKRQWFSIHQFDPNDQRRITASWDEFVEYYNRMTVGLEEANHYILQYVDGLLSEYGLSYEDLILCGFSQGAMCAAYSGLMCPNKIGAVISFSGILAAKGYIEKHSKSRPEFLLIHGNNDDKIRFDALDFTNDNLQKLGCKTQTFMVDGGLHKISEEAVKEAVNFIKSKI